MPANASVLLEEDGRFPLSAIQKPLWPRREDVFRFVMSILDKAPKFEDHPVSDVLTEAVRCHPNLRSYVSHAHKGYIDQLLSVCAVRGSCIVGYKVSIFSDLAADNDDVFVESDVLAVDANGLLPEPEAGLYTARLRLLNAVEACFAAIEPLDLAEHRQIEAAIALHLWKMDQRTFPSPFQANGWSLGQNFSRSLENCGLLANRARLAAVLRAVSLVVSDPKLRTTHALRENSSGASKQLIRKSDGAAAWRVDVDDELHVHYWKADLGVEFADVVFHNNFYITQ